MLHATDSHSVVESAADTDVIQDRDIYKTTSANASDSWTDFILSELIPISHPWIRRFSSSTILNHNTGSDLISTTDKEIYGDSAHPIAFRIGNGGAGFTGILKVLCLKFISTAGNDFRIGWVANHSRHTQTAMLADIVQVALTYEPQMEELALREGWCNRVCAPAFWDHFVLAGPSSNPARIIPGCTSTEALRRIAEHRAVFHTRGDGSATFEKEQRLWKEAGIDVQERSWVRTHAVSPYPALEKAAEEGAYLLTDRATFLTAKNDGVISDLVVYVEGEELLLNPCSALINTKVPDTKGQRLATRFAEWLKGDDAQSILRDYGRSWKRGMPLFTHAEHEEFSNDEKLAGQDM